MCITIMLQMAHCCDLFTLNSPNRFITIVMVILLLFYVPLTLTWSLVFLTVYAKLSFVKHHFKIEEF